MENNGMLYLCATPIGNLEDITLRVLRTLESVDVIYCEDTRNSLKLLRHYEINKPLQSFHDFSRDSQLAKIVQAVADGKEVALISDAGMPGISDPGYALVNAFQEAHLPYTVLPGASASVTALVLSGLPSDRFSFEGFLPRKNKDLDQRLQLLDQATAPTIIYESPHRLAKTLETFAKRWPERGLVATREISKKFEEVVRGTTESVLAHFEEHPIRGEFVLILGEATTTPQTEEDIFATALAHAQALVAEGESVNQAAKDAAKKYQCQKRTLYQALLTDS